MEVKGSWNPEWQPLVNAFKENFSFGEDGAALCLNYQGNTVVDIWAGERRNRASDIEAAPWDENTLVNVFSASKALVAVCVLQLVEQGLLDLDAPISHYWPEFTGNGKELITTKMVLSHRSGLSAFHPVMKDDSIYNWAGICEVLAVETPWWEPDTEQGYSPFIYGWMLGELVRRVSGAASFNGYFQKNIAAPLGISCHFGVPNSLQQNIADTQPWRRPPEMAASVSGADSQALGRIMKANPRGVTNRAFTNPLSLMTSTNSTLWRDAQIPAAGGHMNARALAAIYGDLASVAPSLLKQEGLALATREVTFSEDNTLGLPLRFSAGFMLSQASRADCRYGRGERGFGHPGAGGSLGFADPDHHIGFGYVTQRMGQSILIDERAIRLINAAYQSLGV